MVLHSLRALTKRQVDRTTSLIGPARGLGFLGDGLEGCRFLMVVVGLKLGWRGVAGVVGDLAVEALVVEPVDVRHRHELDVEAAPWSLLVHQLPCVEPGERLGEGSRSCHLSSRPRRRWRSRRSVRPRWGRAARGRAGQRSRLRVRDRSSAGHVGRALCRDPKSTIDGAGRASWRTRS